MLPSGNADQFIRCQDCGDIFFLASPEENRRRYEQHLQFCKKKKVSKEKKQAYGGNNDRGNFEG